MQLLCKDASTANENCQYKILNYSHDGHGKEFFGKAQDLHSNKKAADALSAKVATMTSFNSWVDAIVEKKGGFYYIKETRCK